MPAASVEADLHENLFEIISSLSLTWQTSLANIIKAKISSFEGEPAELPLICVAPANRPGFSEFWCTATDDSPPLKQQDYVFEIGMIAQGNKDPITGLSDIQNWRQRISRATCSNPSQYDFSQAGSQIYNAIELRDPVIDRKAWMSNLDVSVMHIKITVLEPAQ